MPEEAGAESGRKRTGEKTARVKTAVDIKPGRLSISLAFSKPRSQELDAPIELQKLEPDDCPGGFPQAAFRCDAITEGEVRLGPLQGLEDGKKAMALSRLLFNALHRESGLLGIAPLECCLKQSNPREAMS
jgi:hypothetical protein